METVAVVLFIVTFVVLVGYGVLKRLMTLRRHRQMHVDPDDAYVPKRVWEKVRMIHVITLIFLASSLW
jgi:hypothetical protein